MKLPGLFISICCCLSLVAQAATLKYLDPAATGTGDGNSWANAYTTAAAAESGAPRDSIIYCADGSLGSLTGDTGESGLLTIEFRKATAADHGSDTGWSASMGDGQSTFTGITINSDSFIFNGATRTESDWGAVASYGFRLPDGAGIVLGPGVDNVTLQYIDIGYAAGTVYPDAPGTAISWNDQTGATWRTNIVLSRLHIHNIHGGIGSREASYVTIEYCRIGPVFSKEMIAHQYGHFWTLRWNQFFDGGADPQEELCTAWIGVFNYSGGGDPADTQSDDWLLYGNTYACLLPTGVTSDEAQEALVFGSTVNRWRMYNETIYNMDGNWGGYLKLQGTDNDTRNILFYKVNDSDVRLGITDDCDNGPTWCFRDNPSTAPPFGGCNDLDNNLTGSENPFNDVGALDFRLKTTFSGTSPKNVADTSIAEIYRTSANGVVHENIGAFETAGAEPPPSSGAPNAYGVTARVGSVRAP